MSTLLKYIRSIQDMLVGLKWLIGGIVCLWGVQYLRIVLDIYFFKTDRLLAIYSDYIRILGMSIDISYLRGKFIHAYLFVPLIQGSVLFAAMSKAISLLYQSLLVPLFKRA